MAIRFDTIGDVISITANLPTITSWTIMGWFKITTDTNDYTAFFKFGTATGAAYILETASDGTTFQLWNNAENNGSTLTVGTWYHLAMTVAGTGASQALAYLNGILDITASGSPNPTAALIVVGDYVTAGDTPLNGCVQDLFVYSAVLTQVEIAQQMRQRWPVRTANLNRWSPCLTAAEAAIDYNNVGNWTVGGTLTTEDGPGVTWSTDEDETFTPTASVVSNYVQRERGIRGLNRGLLVGV